MQIRTALFVCAFVACSREQQQVATTTTQAPPTASQTVATQPTESTATETTATETVADDTVVSRTWRGQIKTGAPISDFNYVGEESGDFAVIRFRNDSEVGKKILAVCKNDDLCEFTGTVKWLDEVPPENASAVGEIRSAENVKRVPPQ